MAFDEKLADRVRGALAGRRDVTERRMFGGLAFLLDGKMFCGVQGGELMVRVGPERHQAALGRPHVRPMDFTGRPMKGYVYVAAPGVKTRKAVARWADEAARFVSGLPVAAGRRK